MGSTASIATDFKEQGDKAYNDKRYFDAIFQYTLAINSEYEIISKDIDGYDYSNDNIYDDLEEINSRIKSKNRLSTLFSNRSDAFLLNLQPWKALDDAFMCIELQPTGFHGYFRASQAYHSLGQIAEAKDFIEKAKALLADDHEEDNFKKLYDEIIISDTKDNDKKIDSNERKSLGQVYSWGSGAHGQLGHATTKDKNFPTMIEGLREKHIIDIGAGTMHSLVTTSAGELYTFGNNAHNQLGTGCSKDADVLSPIIIPSLVGIKIKSVAVGAGHSLAISSEGKCYAWGINKQGQLGLSHNSTVNQPTLISIIQKEITVAVSCGIAHTFFLLRNGDLLSCGMNNFGQLGLGGTEQYVLSPTIVKIEGLVGVTHIACGGIHTLLIDNNNKVYACGSNSCLQLGIEGCKDSNHFKPVIALKTVEAAFVSCGEEFSCLISKSRSVYSWGLTLHDGELESRSTPTLIRDLDGLSIESLSCSQKQIFAIAASGDVYTYGIVNDDMPEIGIGIDKVAVMKKPERIASFGKHKRIRQLVAGRKHFIALTIGAYGPYCIITKGLLESVTEMTCDGKLKFQIKSYDTNGHPLDSGGAIFRIRVDHEISDYDIKLRKLLATDIDGQLKKKIDESTIIDDNFDGCYDGVISLFFSGVYSITITLNELEIQNSPYRVECMAGKISPLHSIAYFGKFADFKSLFNESGSVNLICNCDDGIVFTVSCYDKYGNKCTDIGNVSIIVECEWQDKDNNDAQNYFSSEAYSRGSNGIVPCVLHAPKETGTYRVSVYLINNHESSKNHIKGSPYNLTVNPKALVDTAQIESTIENAVITEDTEDIITEEDKKIVALTKMEITRKRAIDCLRKKMNLIKFEKEMKRKNKACVRRVGGGFSITYSKEI